MGHLTDSESTQLGYIESTTDTEHTQLAYIEQKGLPVFATTNRRYACLYKPGYPPSQTLELAHTPNALERCAAVEDTL